MRHWAVRISGLSLPDHAMPGAVGRWSPAGGRGWPEEDDRWCAQGGGQVGDAGIAADHKPGCGDDGRQIEDVGLTGQDPFR